MRFLLLAAALRAVGSQTASGSGTTTTSRPTIAVYAHRSNADHPSCGGSCDELSGSYVDWLLGAGALIAPIPHDASASQIKTIMAGTNGLLLPGGDWHYFNSSTIEPLHLIYQLALDANAVNGSSYPVFGVCTGFEFMTNVTAGGHILEKGFDAVGAHLDMVFSDYGASSESRLFADSPALRTILATKPIAYNEHWLGVRPETFMANPMLRDFYEVVSTTHDRDGHNAFVSTVEGRTLPFYGLQWHPEHTTYATATTAEAAPKYGAEILETSQYIAQIFVEEARKNGRSFKSKADEMTYSVFNYELARDVEHNGFRHASMRNHGKHRDDAAEAETPAWVYYMHGVPPLDPIFQSFGGNSGGGGGVDGGGSDGSSRAGDDNTADAAVEALPTGAWDVDEIAVEKEVVVVEGETTFVGLSLDVWNSMPGLLLAFKNTVAMEMSGDLAISPAQVMAGPVAESIGEAMRRRLRERRRRRLLGGVLQLDFGARAAKRRRLGDDTSGGSFDGSLIIPFTIVLDDDQAQETDLIEKAMIQLKETMDSSATDGADGQSGGESSFVSTFKNVAKYRLGIVEIDDVKIKSKGSVKKTVIEATPRSEWSAEQTMAFTKDVFIIASGDRTVHIVLAATAGSFLVLCLGAFCLIFTQIAIAKLKKHHGWRGKIGRGLKKMTKQTRSWPGAATLLSAAFGSDALAGSSDSDDDGVDSDNDGSNSYGRADGPRRRRRRRRGAQADTANDEVHALHMLFGLGTTSSSQNARRGETRDIEYVVTQEAPRNGNALGVLLGHVNSPREVAPLRHTARHEDEVASVDLRNPFGVFLDRHRATEVSHASSSSSSSYAPPAPVYAAQRLNYKEHAAPLQALVMASSTAASRAPGTTTTRRRGAYQREVAPNTNANSQRSVRAAVLAAAAPARTVPPMSHAFEALVNGAAYSEQRDTTQLRFPERVDSSRPGETYALRSLIGGGAYDGGKEGDHAAADSRATADFENLIASASSTIFANDSNSTLRNLLYPTQTPNLSDLHSTINANVSVIHPPLPHEEESGAPVGLHSLLGVPLYNEYEEGGPAAKPAVLERSGAGQGGFLSLLQPQPSRSATSGELPTGFTSLINSAAEWAGLRAAPGADIAAPSADQPGEVSSVFRALLEQ